jgi:hypothetical protein
MLMHETKFISVLQVYILKKMKIIHDLVASIPPTLVAEVLVYLSAEEIEEVLVTKIVIATVKEKGKAGDRKLYDWLADHGVEICCYHNITKQASSCVICDVKVMTCPKKGIGSNFTQMKCMSSDEACGICQAVVCDDCCSDRYCMECGLRFCVGICSDEECKFCFGWWP